MCSKMKTSNNALLIIKEMELDIKYYDIMNVWCNQWYDVKARMSFLTCTYANVVYLLSSLNVKEMNGQLNNIFYNTEIEDSFNERPTTRKLGNMSANKHQWGHKKDIIFTRISSNEIYFILSSLGNISI